MRLIDIDALWEELGILYHQNNGKVTWNDALMEIKTAPTIEPEREKWTWHKTDEDDLTTFPDDDRMVLVSFSNFSLPMLGRWQVDDYLGGAWYQGDMDDTFVDDNLFVDGWWELPKKEGEHE